MEVTTTALLIIRGEARFFKRETTLKNLINTVEDAKKKASSFLSLNKRFNFYFASWRKKVIHSVFKIQYVL